MSEKVKKIYYLQFHEYMDQIKTAACALRRQAV